MTFRIKNLTIKNFLSIGNVTQAVDFDRTDLTLVLGENLDLGGAGEGARNGVGKSSLVNALSYAFYGVALTNIRKNNLINKTNGKNMLVTVEFEHNGINYKIERGRAPTFTTFYVGDTALEAKDNDAHGDSRETQLMIERIIGMSHDMFKHIVALNTYTDPFLNLRANEQRIIIEQLLGITLLSEKADALKEEIRKSKESIASEENKCTAIQEANKKILEQIESIKRRERLWASKKAADIETLTSTIGELSKIDIDVEIAAHLATTEINLRVKDRQDLATAITRLDADILRENKTITQVTKELSQLADHRCHSCGQEIHDATHEKLTAAKSEILTSRQVELETLIEQKSALSDALSDFDDIPQIPKKYYRTIEEAYNHRTTLEHHKLQLETKSSEVSPYSDQIEEMETKAVVEFDYATINSATKLRDHQEFLFKLLTNKDSFIRKRIIDQNLAYLNTRLSHYLDKIGLPHRVLFQNDLTVSIEELGREMDFDSLSRGERNRLILSMSFAFRDVWESLYQPINLLFVDELIDSGMDAIGVENSIGILKRMTRDSNKSVWLISHRDELIARVSQVLKVIKENGFTSISTEADE